MGKQITIGVSASQFALNGYPFKKRFALTKLRHLLLTEPYFDGDRFIFTFFEGFKGFGDFVGSELKNGG